MRAGCSYLPEVLLALHPYTAARLTCSRDAAAASSGDNTVAAMVVHWLAPSPSLARFAGRSSLCEEQTASQVYIFQLRRLSAAVIQEM